ncbi:SapC family protein [Microbulbifer thermotolerans]|uniref:SapC family protein n=1 Tax=Microbulbifer thermotolerans TaxID=252514 RepID=F1SWD1_MICTH|nr:SapC family protein [Microbulbifer thermotolerans]AMX02908.1 hypothetical protein A3224_10275 [Microbulbifer thermotolerans]MCX2780455.1 SapC family protein [Microbulbifer thermotolerans]MCX2784528.1 SapC family protein [Microbulbifer thermotolerans]MCX2794823.1 SapC family protein [Microbulbifer thermotolerans]MCX2802950.1 SapC family protein [Microbulbifer thermotolerans]
MAKAVALNNERHRNLRVITKRGAEYGENTNLVPVIADELRNLVLEYPVCITKNPNNGQFSLCALLGFEPDENLFLYGDEWKAEYLPLHIRRQPFMVGHKKTSAEGDTEALIIIDTDSERVQEKEGERLFNDDGSKSSYLEEVTVILSQLISGMTSTSAFLKYLAEEDLIEPVQLSVRFSNGEQKRYEGLYTVNDEKLQKLDAARLVSMHQRGYLQAAYWLSASMGQVRKLIALKNDLIK